MITAFVLSKYISFAVFVLYNKMSRMLLIARLSGWPISQKKREKIYAITNKQTAKPDVRIQTVSNFYLLQFEIF